MIPLRPENDMTYELDFQLTSAPGMWLKTDVTCREAVETIRTGLLKNQQVSRINLFCIAGEPAVNFVYDISAAKSGGDPWSLMEIPT